MIFDDESATDAHSSSKNKWFAFRCRWFFQSENLFFWGRKTWGIVWNMFLRSLRPIGAMFEWAKGRQPFKVCKQKSLSSHFQQLSDRFQINFLALRLTDRQTDVLKAWKTERQKDRLEAGRRRGGAARLEAGDGGEAESDVWRWDFDFEHNSALQAKIFGG